MITVGVPDATTLARGFYHPQFPAGRWSALVRDGNGDPCDVWLRARDYSFPPASIGVTTDLPNGLQAGRMVGEAGALTYPLTIQFIRVDADGARRTGSR